MYVQDTGTILFICSLEHLNALISTGVSAAFFFAAYQIDLGEGEVWRPTVCMEMQTRMLTGQAGNENAWGPPNCSPGSLGDTAPTFLLWVPFPRSSKQEDGLYAPWSPCISFFFFFCCARDTTQGLTCARHLLYSWAIHHSRTSEAYHLDSSLSNTED